MSTAKDNAYLDARGKLNAAMGAYIRAAEAIDASPQSIADDVNDSLCDASERNIIVADTAIQ